MSESNNWASHLQSIKNRRKDRSERLQKKKIRDDSVTFDQTENKTTIGFVVAEKGIEKEEAIVDVSIDKPDNANDETNVTVKNDVKESTKDDIESLLSLQTAVQKEQHKQSKELAELLSTPSWQERTLREKFVSADVGKSVQEFCQYNTKEECRKQLNSSTACKKLHFIKIINANTDETLGDCSFLNTCFNINTCKYIHYKVDESTEDTDTKQDVSKPALKKIKLTDEEPAPKLYPPQWIQCDLRSFNMNVLGKFAVVMADPPWDIHMELPYGTMSDDEMRKLDIPSLQEDGYIFLWTTGRALELARECLKLWGYERGDELIWVKTNQLQRLIRTGRTGHWLNHAKEHCLIGVKGNTSKFNRGLDCDVIVAEVRATSHKPDEIYGIIERLAPGMRKVELFGRPHNVQPNWVTLGNQVEGTVLLDPDVVETFRKVYPDGNAMAQN